MTSSGVGWPFWVIQTLVAAAAIPVLVALYRALSRRHPLAAKLFALGLILRGIVGAMLFFTSYMELPFLPGLQAGDGFWTLAPDARVYYEHALSAAGGGSVPGGAPSPAYIRVLSLWMMLVGMSPAAALLLNICCYASLSWVLVRLLTPAAAPLAVAAFAFSPSLLVFGTQPLKDVFFATVVAGVCIATLWLFRAPRAGDARRWWVAGLVAALALYLVAGIRTYYALFLWGSLSLVLAGTTFSAWRQGFGRSVTRAAAVVLLCWLAVVAGSGSYLKVLISQVRMPGRGEATSSEPLLSNTVHAFDRARGGFIRSGGGTNLGGGIAAEGFLGRLEAVGFGTLLLTVPVSPLDWLGVVEVQGGRGMLAVADLDTLFVDASVIAVIVLLVRNARQRRLNRPYVAFILIVSVVTAVSLAYVVTNFGTLFRLRLMAVVPLWMLPLALIPPFRNHRMQEGADSRAGQPPVERGSRPDA